MMLICAEISAPERRNGPRYPYFESATALSADAETSVAIVDISRGGLRAVTLHPVGVGCRLMFSIGGEYFMAEVVWRTDFLIGCKFAEELSEEMLQSILDRAVQLQPPE
jgi:hypothetical protein